MTKKSEKIWTGNVRDAALTILMAVEKQQAYSNLLLHQTIEKYTIDAKDRALLTELTYGTLQYKMTLDYYLQPFIKGKLDDWVKQLLRLSLYQIHYLSRIPDHAAVNEAVEIAKRRGHKGIASAVNGILRSILREGVRSTEDIKDREERLSIETSHPLWMVKRFISQYGFETTDKMLKENNEPPVTTLRVNLFKRTVDQVLHLMTQEGHVVAKSEIIPECIYLFNGQAARTTAYQEGFVTIQDESSMIPAYVLQPEPGMTVLDMCSAPGGKTTHIAEKMKNTGKLVAMDIHQHKLKLVKENAERLGFSFIETVEMDGRKASENYAPQSFDRILVDAPCSGLGVMKRKPDIKYTKKEKDFASLKPIQMNLLEEAYKLLKPDGLMVYSTCTVDLEENEGTTQQFLDAHPDMELQHFPDVIKRIKKQEKEGTLQIFPQDLRSDGFYVALFQKRYRDHSLPNSKEVNDKMKFVVKTDVGMKRTVNEDRVEVFMREDGRLLAVVADGMGGHKAGDVASELAVSEFKKYFAAFNPFIVKARDWLTYTFQSINQTVSRHSKMSAECAGMGTTLIAGLFEKHQGIVAHVGDSRVYLISHEQVLQITRDHSYVNVLIDSGEISEEQAKTHPNKNVLMKAIGTERTIQPDFYDIAFHPNSYLLFCTDGLSNKISERLMQSILYSNRTLEEKGQDLVDEANKSGGEDNISLILLSNNDEEV